MTGLIKAATVKARKDYACMCCGALAARAGDEYRRETYVFDGRIYDWVSCDPCQSITGDVFEWAMAPDEGVGPEDYHEWATEHTDDPLLGADARAFLARFGATP